MTKLTFALFGSLALLTACSAATDAPEPPNEDDLSDVQASGVHSDTFTYYVVTRPDLRKCMYPLCGGYFVKRVNRALTRCADGKWRQDCHMVDLDLSQLGVSADTESDFESSVFGAGHGLVRGDLVSIKGADTLVASEAWVGAAESTPTGGFYRVTDSGIVCFTYPCPSLREDALNSYKSRNLAALDLFTSGATLDQINDGYSAIYEKSGVLVAGLHGIVSGPGGKALGLSASEFYLPLQDAQFCVTLEVPTPGSTTFYAKNFSSVAGAKDFIANFPYGENAQILTGPCNQPKACTKEYAPVCGVIKDSPENTYGNACQFEAALMADAGSEAESKGYYSAGECGGKCDYSDPQRIYVATSPEQCQVLKPAPCQPGYSFFSDECGCGCELSKGEPCGPNTCAAGQVCCNASCGICTEPGMFCTQQAC